MNTATTQKIRQVDWINSIFLVSLPMISIVGVVLSVRIYGFEWSDFFLMAVLGLLTGVSVTGGYHRLLAHRAYQSGPLVKLFYLLFGAAAVENSALCWATDHRNHHRFVDTDQDPYNVKRGFFWAHMGWVFFKDPAGRSFEHSTDLKNDSLVMFQDRFYLVIAVLMGLGLPMLLGHFLFDRALPALAWAGFMKTLLLHHFTFLINSAAHYFGYQPYSTANSARDNPYLAWITLGEGYHNFHHTFQADYRNGYEWYQMDPTKWWIFGLSKLGLTSNLQTVSNEIVWATKMRLKMRQAEEQVEKKLSPRALAIKEQLETLHHRLEDSLRKLAQLKAKYQEWKRIEFHALPHFMREESRRNFKNEIRHLKDECRLAWKDFCSLFQELSFQPA